MLTAQQRKTRGGVTLRHWTTDSVLFVGGRQGPSRARAARELGDGRLELVASKLKSIKAELV